ncbi:DoxX family protein [Aureibaculum sp. 2210JD6-5]|uniref:DoxX family protein n=1 Tax=Aureibaculum sp. 2210JD6-5 TaxID=3103957 RepID=UPI002AAEA1A8|nr:DoxX family protein [Aureibaculum sp. 2210JD6-5]MDY7394342.1 DoxX family protein [Aureibaculum sp. 2210JD6-5]
MTSKIYFVLRLLVALILVQTLYFKFTAHPDSIHIFSTLGLEPYGRIGIGILELIAAILILVPKTVWMGALLSLGIISGAIFSHLTKLGIEVNGDGGKVFYMALVVFILSIIILLKNRKNIPFVNKKG